MDESAWLNSQMLIFNAEQRKAEARERKHVALQKEDYELLRQYATEQGLQMTKAIVKAIKDSKKLENIRNAFYDTRVDLALWYCEKLAFSVQALKIYKNDNQLKRLLRLLKQVEERYNIDVHLIEDVAKAFIKDDADIATLNEALKETMKMILRKVMLNEL